MKDCFPKFDSPNIQKRVEAATEMFRYLSHPRCIKLLKNDETLEKFVQTIKNKIIRFKKEDLIKNNVACMEYMKKFNREFNLGIEFD